MPKLQRITLISNSKSIKLLIREGMKITTCGARAQALDLDTVHEELQKPDIEQQKL